MGRKITLKLVLIYLVTVCIMFFLLNVVGARRMEESILEKRKNSMLNEANIIATEYGDKYYHAGTTLIQLKKQLSSIDRFLDVRVILLNASGTIYLDTRDNLALNIDSYLGGIKKDYYTNLLIPDLCEEPILLVCAPIYADFSLKGYVALISPMSEIHSETFFFVDSITLIILVFSLVLMLMFVFIYIMTVQPVVVLKKIAVEYAKKNYEYTTKAKLRDEYYDIAEAMRVTVDEIDRLEDYQKKFVGNVSHDFRSPLTSIKGYIEAIKDGTIPIESAERYLDIILFETERLTKLTEDLLNLSRMDNNVELDISMFDINSMVKRTAASFEGTCKKKRITIELQFCDKEVYISADYSRVQQVLYNLIDNAIKFSNVDSSIIIKVEIRLTKVYISVKDSGIGIPVDAQTKIFERFYKTDLSRGKDKRGTGLGLAIVKEIIEAHGENITVVSTEGVGTEFTFTMPRAEM